MPGLFADENFPQPVVEELRRLGHDVLTMLDAGLAEQAIPDAVVLGLARDRGRALLTINRRDFIHLHNRGTPHAGIIACTQDRDFPGQAARIHAEIAGRTSLANELIRVNRPRSYGSPMVAAGVADRGEGHAPLALRGPAPGSASPASCRSHRGAVSVVRGAAGRRFVSGEHRPPSSTTDPDGGRCPPYGRECP